MRLCCSHGKLTAQAGFWQIMSGISIGCAISAKWTGVLMIPVIWVSILHDSWNKLCERHNSIKSIVKGLVTNVLSTMLLPLCVYLAIFQLHFNLIPNAGDHDLLVSSHLKYSLQGNSLEPSQPSKCIEQIFIPRKQKKQTKHDINTKKNRHCLWLANCNSTRWHCGRLSPFAQKEIHWRKHAAGSDIVSSRRHQQHLDCTQEQPDLELVSACGICAQHGSDPPWALCIYAQAALAWSPPSNDQQKGAQWSNVSSVEMAMAVHKYTQTKAASYKGPMAIALFRIRMIFGHYACWAMMDSLTRTRTLHGNHSTKSFASFIFAVAPWSAITRITLLLTVRTIKKWHAWRVLLPMSRPGL